MNPKSPSMVPAIERARIIKPSNQETWHSVTPTRFACTLPPVKGPVRARADRATMRPNLPAVDPFGTPQLPNYPRPSKAIN